MVSMAETARQLAGKSIYVARDKDNRKVFVEAETPERAKEILVFVADVDESAPIAEHDDFLGRSVKVYTEEDGKAPLLGGEYIFHVRELDGWAAVARFRLGTLWSEFYQFAVTKYGEENVKYTFELDRDKQVSALDEYDL
jgi:hypothetical protein